MNTERQTEGLLDAISFAFVSVAVTELGVRPSVGSIARFRARVAEALERSRRGPFDSDEPTEPRTGRALKR